MHYLSVIFPVLGIALVVLGIYSLNRTRNFLQRAHSTSGIVIEIVRKQVSTGRGLTYTNVPVVRFKTIIGEIIEFESSVGNPSLQVGDEVTVLYDPDKPQQATLGSSPFIWLTTYICFLIGGALFIVGIVALYVSK